ncbi:MAG: protein kinase, partial [Thermoanaerobaculia bacterium]
MSSSLLTGTMLGQYRIVAPLGAGGMGEVYRAHDGKLDRPVAIKVLPESVVRDAERVRRFVQEARAASSLSHPNIITIHDIGEAVPVAEGGEPQADAAPVHFIAMELVEGRTLRQLYEDRSVEPRTLLSYLAQAAEGLAKAHAAGIVHRDLKPENVMVTRDGYSKVLDFGLAKLTETPTQGSALAAAPTAMEERTREGAVMGTVGYMSPEQAMGKPVDHRTDLFAFGCLLYEAATGRKPFAGESSVDVLHAIVREKPVPVEEIAPEIPRDLVKTIRRCLAKDPDRRFQSMKDLALELHEIVDDWETLALPTGTVSSASALAAAEPGRRRGLGRAGWLAVAAGAIALALAGWVAWHGSRAAQPAPSAFQQMKLTAATSSGDIREAALSPDGRYLVSIRREGNQASLWLRQLATSSDVQLLEPQSRGTLANPLFTPDGNYVTYTLSDELGSRYTLFRMPTLGGPSRQLVVDIDTPVTFSPDGARIAWLRNSPERREATILIADADGSAEKTLATRRSDDGHAYSTNDPGLGPAWSPDGRSIAVAGFSRTGEVRSEVLLVDVATGAERPVGELPLLGISGLAWLPGGEALIVACIPDGSAFAPQLWRLAVADGKMTRITNDSLSYQGVSVRADGQAMATVQVIASSTLWRRPLADARAERQLSFGSREAVYDLRTSADGTLFFSFQGGTAAGVVRMDPEGGDRVPLSRSETLAQQVQPSRDGRTILFRSRLTNGKLGLVAADRDGNHAREIPTPNPEAPFVLHPDGTWFVSRDARGILRQS